MMERANLNLYLDLRNEAPEGAGWYLSGTVDGSVVIPPIALSEEAAQGLAGAILSAIQTSGGPLPGFTPLQIILSGNQAIRPRLAEQLAWAEEQARRVAKLRRKLATLDPNEETQDPHSGTNEPEQGV